jgi:hypothetical protein
MTTNTPPTDITRPDRLIMLNLSLKKKAVATGLKSGIVDTITAARVEETNLTPKLSPRKYKKGSKKVASINKGRSSFRIL